MNIKRSQGFTIIEIMISVMILAALAFLAAPAMRDLIQKNKIEVTSTSIMRSIVAARSEAISRNQPVVMCSSTDGATCSTGGWDEGWISYADVDDDSTLDVGEEVFGVFQVVDPVTVRSTAFNPNIMSFNSDGTLDQVVSFRACGSDADTENAYTVSISVTGRPRSSKGTASCP